MVLRWFAGGTLFLAGVAVLGWSLWFTATNVIPYYEKAVQTGDYVAFNLSSLFLLYLFLPVAGIFILEGSCCIPHEDWESFPAGVGWLQGSRVSQAQQEPYWGLFCERSSMGLDF